MPSDFVIHIEFPALDNYVAWKREITQKKVDALTETIEALTSKLEKSSTDLNNAIEESKTKET